MCSHTLECFCGKSNHLLYTSINGKCLIDCLLLKFVWDESAVMGVGGWDTAIHAVMGVGGWGTAIYTLK